jgi:hypothetical protein
MSAIWKGVGDPVQVEPVELSKGIVQDAQEKSMLHLIVQITEYNAYDRISATEALASAQVIKPEKERKGVIVQKTPLKRWPGD